MEIILTNVRGSFLEVFEAKQFNGAGAYRFSGNFVIEASDEKNLTLVRNTIKQAATDKWADKAPAMLKTLLASDKVCLHNGDTKEYDGYPGNFFISAADTVQPAICGPRREPISQKSGQIYNGAYYNVKVDIYAQDNEFGKRINAKLKVVQWIGKGDAWGGGAPGNPDDMPDMGPQAGSTAGADADPFADDGLPF